MDVGCSCFSRTGTGPTGKMEATPFSEMEHAHDLLKKKCIELFIHNLHYFYFHEFVMQAGNRTVAVYVEVRGNNFIEWEQYNYTE